MPNYTHTKLFITGDINQIKEIIGEEFLLKNTVPPPEGMIQKESAVGNEWFIDNWGVKWDVECYKTVITEKITQLKFISPWETPLIWLRKTSELYPDLSFRLYWCDEDFPKSGKAMANAGEITGFNYTDGKIAEKFVKRHFWDMWDVHRGNDTEELSEASENEYEKEYNILEREYERIDKEFDEWMEKFCDEHTELSNKFNVELSCEKDSSDYEDYQRYKQLKYERNEKVDKVGNKEDVNYEKNYEEFVEWRDKFQEEFDKLFNKFNVEGSYEKDSPEYEEYMWYKQLDNEYDVFSNLQEDIISKQSKIREEKREKEREKEEKEREKEMEKERGLIVEKKIEDDLSTDCEDSDSESLDVDERNYINNDSVEEIHKQHLNVRMFCDLMPILLQKDFEKLTNAIQNLK